MTHFGITPTTLFDDARVGPGPPWATFCPGFERILALRLRPVPVESPPPWQRTVQSR